MKHFILYVIIFLTSRAHSFCLQTFNGYGPAYATHVASRTQAFSEELGREGCEVIHLQEIWNEDQSQIVQSVLKDLYFIYSPNHEVRFGLESLSKVRVLQKTYSIFKFNDDGGLLDGGRDLFGVSKGFVAQTIAMTSGKYVDFINLHLHPMSQEVRLAQIYELISWYLRQPEQRPLVMSGDFNMAPRSLEYRFVMAALKLRDSVIEKWGMYPAQFCTYCAGNALGWGRTDQIFDYVFFSLKAPLSVSDIQVNLMGNQQGPYSDHYGLRVDFNFDINFQPNSPSRELESERARLIEILAQAQRLIEKKYSKASRIYNDLGYWGQQLQKRKGPLWDYFVY